MSKIRLGLIAALAVLGVMVPAGAASAATFTGACTFDGRTTQLVPVGFTSNTGTFGFAGSATCVDSGGNVYTGSITVDDGTGTYSNIVCGTGTASGTALLDTNGPDITASFRITFAGGTGVIEITTNGTAAGAVNIRPSENNEPNPATNACVTEWDVNGGFAGTVTV
jgi:hypothetical protein